MESIEGIIKIANVVLSLVAGFLALSLFKISHHRKELKPWKLLIASLVLFVVQEILGALRAFQIYETPYLTHIVPTLILGLLVWALVLQIRITK